MKQLFNSLLILIAILPSACERISGEAHYSTIETRELEFKTYQGHPIYPKDDPNVYFAPVLLPGELKFDEVLVGQSIPQNSVIAMPNLGESATLTVEFNRSDLEDNFIDDFFFGNDETVRNNHPFASPGIEPILTDSRLILNIYPDVLLHLRNGMENKEDYDTFLNNDVMAKVTSIQGNVLVSTDRQYTRIKLGYFYVTSLRALNVSSIDSNNIIELEDGSYEITDPLGGYVGPFPMQFQPRVIVGP